MMKQSQYQILKGTEEKCGYGVDESKKFMCDFFLANFWSL